MQNRKEQSTEEKSKQISIKDLKMQRKVAKEIENFLNYNGEIQDDI